MYVLKSQSFVLFLTNHFLEELTNSLKLQANKETTLFNKNVLLKLNMLFSLNV